MSGELGGFPARESCYRADDAETAARAAAALKQCKGKFTAVTIKQACATVATICLLLFVDND